MNRDFITVMFGSYKVPYAVAQDTYLTTNIGSSRLNFKGLDWQI